MIEEMTTVQPTSRRRSARATEETTMPTETTIEIVNETPAAEVLTPQEWAKQVADHLGTAQQRWMELAEEQNSLTAKAIEEAISFYRDAPNMAVGEWVRQGIANLTDAPQQLAENAAQQRERLVSTLTGRNINITTPVQRVAEALQQPVERLAEARKQWLDFVGKQNDAYVTAIQRGLGSENSPIARLVDLQKQSVHQYIEVQKRWLEVTNQLFFSRRNTAETAE